MIEMKKTATVLFVILGLSIIAAMIGISTSANERANENLSFTVKTDRIVYDMTQQVITIPVKPNKSVNASDVHAVLTYGWDGNGKAKETDNRKSDLPETGSRTLNKLITWMGVLLILIVGASYFRSLFHRVK